MSQVVRFWSKVEVTDSGCWEFRGSIKPNGYGHAWLDGRLDGAHRAAWRLSNGEIPPGQWVLHHCDNPPCCNPDHLFLGDRTRNVRDMYAKQRGKGGPRGRMIDDATLDAVTADCEAGVKHRDIADKHGVSIQWVSKVNRGLVRPWRNERRAA